MRFSLRVIALAALVAPLFAHVAKAVPVRMTIMTPPRILTPDTPRFRPFGAELPPCRKEKKRKPAAVETDDDRAPCRRVDR